MVEDSIYRKFNKMKKDRGLTASALLVELIGETKISRAGKTEGGGK